jgi:hypothetical protein
MPMGDTGSGRGDWGEGREGKVRREERKEAEENTDEVIGEGAAVLLEPWHKSSTNDEGAPQGQRDSSSGVHMATWGRQQRPLRFY